MTIQYDPKARFDIDVREEPFRRTAKGRQLMARIYQPKGAGPCPVLLDLHGGAWNNKDRFANETMARAVAASGVLVVSIDMTLAPEAPYPASVQDAKHHAGLARRQRASFTSGKVRRLLPRRGRQVP